ncbi:uncharacterized protein BT62DRAFT_1041159 [Guyanagaster necrorhizus]|uniref:Uncharacterized protein n=1 Tax=Guyanagaster necrorhizus TaxID=856835 RepID=A0A9P8ANR7_9AGAR|nr:uncharacterized protein BT62DRAFT_1041159 [Guyanagaster necrorhizus MCA 3950]KAG7442026.1 hypothetical protein BT62DRAFT_1041159 [Guyanagaster necrorhizus MCA 3950]
MKEKQLQLENVSSPTDLEGQAPRIGNGDAALAVLGDKTAHREITAEENKRVLRKIDMWLMPITLLVHFLQQLDKTGWNPIYSWLSSIVYLAQLIWQPASSYFLVKLPIAKYLFFNIFMWGAVVACTAAAHDFKGLLAGRFFLGISEATVAPCFMTIMQMWWRRREQTMRLSRGIGMVGSLFAWDLVASAENCMHIRAFQRKSNILYCVPTVGAGDMIPKTMARDLTAGPAETKNYAGTVKTNEPLRDTAVDFLHPLVDAWEFMWNIMDYYSCVLRDRPVGKGIPLFNAQPYDSMQLNAQCARDVFPLLDAAIFNAEAPLLTELQGSYGLEPMLCMLKWLPWSSSMRVDLLDDLPQLISALRSYSQGTMRYFNISEGLVVRLHEFCSDQELVATLEGRGEVGKSLRNNMSQYVRDSTMHTSSHAFDLRPKGRKLWVRTDYMGWDYPRRDAILHTKVYVQSITLRIDAFGPLIISINSSSIIPEGFGFNGFKTILFNIPFSAMQAVVTLLAAEFSTRLKLKWPVVFGLTLPPIAGASGLYKLGRGTELRNALLGCYYVLSFRTGLQPMLHIWSSQNTAGHAKKLCNTGIIFVAQYAGNVTAFPDSRLLLNFKKTSPRIVGPLLYTTDQKPYYHRGLIAKVTAAYLAFLNRRHAEKRRQLGKAGNITDKSLRKLDDHHDNDEGEAKYDQSFDDLTDRKNEEFIYVL